MSEILAKLNPKSTWASREQWAAGLLGAGMPAGGGAGMSITAHDVAAALAGDPEGAEVIYALHAGDAQALRRVRAALLEHPALAAWHETPRGWAVDLILVELTHRSQCGRCKGTGASTGRPTMGVLPVCPSCGGSGLQALSGRERARRCGIHRDTWRRRYAAGYEQAFRWLAGIEERARRRVLERLR